MKLKAARITEIHPQIFAMMKAANLYLEVQSQQANFSVNKTIQMKEYTEDFICKDDAVYCTILHFFRSTTSVCCTHNYRPCTVTEAQTIPVSITIMPTP